MSLEGAFDFYRLRGVQTKWGKKIFNRFILPKLAIFAWICMTNSLPTGQNFRRRRMKIVRLCLDCIHGETETMDHLLLICKPVVEVWKWVSNILREDFTRHDTIQNLLKHVAESSMKQEINKLRLAMVLYAAWEIWKRQNGMAFNRKITSPTQVCNIVLYSIRKIAFLINGFDNHSSMKIRIFAHLGINSKFQTCFTLTAVYWIKPPWSWWKVNTDGAALGQPGTASCAGIFRMFRGFTQGCFADPLVRQNANYAELMGIIRAIEIEDTKQWFPLWIETDSLSSAKKVVYSSMVVPWRLKRRWRKCLYILQNHPYKISHIYREGNKVADALTNMGLEMMEYSWWNEVLERARQFYERNINNVMEIRVSH